MNKEKHIYVLTKDKKVKIAYLRNPGDRFIFEVLHPEVGCMHEKTKLENGYTIATFFIGDDINFKPKIRLGEPIFFHTLSYLEDSGDPSINDGATDFTVIAEYSTYDEAMEGHKKFVENKHHHRFSLIIAKCVEEEEGTW